MVGSVETRIGEIQAFRWGRSRDATGAVVVASTA
jgi:hypothetical protein